MQQNSTMRRVLPPTPGSRGSSYTPRPPRRRRRLGFRLVVLLLLLCSLLIWPGPQLVHYAQANLTPGAVANLLGRNATRLPGGIEAFANSTGPHQYWQVGLGGSDNSAHATGMRTVIETRVPQQVSQDTTNYFWIGSYLADRSFIQAGYFVPSYDTARAGWFYCAFGGDGKQGPCKYGALGTAGSNGTRHTYTLESSIDATGQPEWRVMLDGAQLGQFTWTSGETGASVPVIYAESSGFTPHEATSQLGPVEFSGIEARHAGNTTYAASSPLRVMYNAPNICPPYGIAGNGHGGAFLGSGLACPPRFSQMG